ncbi:2-C-methyl-D-erythritol 4-phosphate cytidylyltransferase [Mucilaginibacter robiniae]|uniref:2-C-methyl-D-erythritol 4-phosphate cytidylyltransferase n=1 Tax=Mucilaginibacter robiniae TaxID=2728022 RepID=A0A7L5E0W3_9SPHI|nr:2-C-methyl-D-erythritol 4-phosphate cytidylyltransferase [Mucilaginibacter robiniae]QJD94463.1 2-C-methyl-D-erythritol 4-phosphate cytidylyltransferase [Mucilaginibacter robiniae]
MDQVISSNSSNAQKAYAIIVAGGSGTRMQSAVPKQFLLLNGKPVLMHTLHAFSQSTYKPELIVVLPETYHSYWRELCNEHHFTITHQVVSGGATRFHSVKNGLDEVDTNSLVAIHDAVRPLISTTIIDDAYEQAMVKGSAIVCVQSRDSVRQVKENKSESLLRDEIYLVQTPQTFQAQILKQAYSYSYQESFTDDASVVEKAGHAIHIIPGSYNNFKITFPDDIAIAEFLLCKKATNL